MPNLLTVVEVQTTRFDPVEAELGVAALLAEPVPDAELRGRFMGPRCIDRDTVEVAYALKPLPPEGDLLRARVVIPEANPWNPKTPFCYQGPIELWRNGEKIEETWLSHGLKQLVLKRNGFFLNGEKLLLRGVPRTQCGHEEALALRAEGVNLLLTRVTGSSAPNELADLAGAAERFGFLLLAQLDGTDEAALWLAESALLHRFACMGWLLPQSLLASPQLWHEAMSLLHGQRRDLFVGLIVQELPLPILPGHVSFLAGDEQILEGLADLADVSLPNLILLRRGQDRPERLTDTPANVLGWVRRA